MAQSCQPPLHCARHQLPGDRPIADLHRLTTSLRGGSERQSKCMVFCFTGQLDAYSDKQFTEFIQKERAGHKLPLVIDLSKIDFIDSSGLGALVQLAKDCNQNNIQFLVVGNARVVQTVKLVRLEQYLHLQPDLTTALDQLAS
ncbi:MAG: STAS domain-containing protein [Cyanobacteriota bacterium]|jgi:anti-sigma B factor antagonist